MSDSSTNSGVTSSLVSTTVVQIEEFQTPDEPLATVSDDLPKFDVSGEHASSSDSNLRENSTDGVSSDKSEDDDDLGTEPAFGQIESGLELKAHPFDNLDQRKLTLRFLSSPVESLYYSLHFLPSYHRRFILVSIVGAIDFVIGAISYGIEDGYGTDHTQWWMKWQLVACAASSAALLTVAALLLGIGCWGQVNSGFCCCGGGGRRKVVGVSTTTSSSAVSSSAVAAARDRQRMIQRKNEKRKKWLLLGMEIVILFVIAASLLILYIAISYLYCDLRQLTSPTVGSIFLIMVIMQPGFVRAAIFIPVYVIFGLLCLAWNYPCYFDATSAARNWPRYVVELVAHVVYLVLTLVINYSFDRRQRSIFRTVVGLHRKKLCLSDEKRKSDQLVKNIIPADFVEIVRRRLARRNRRLARHNVIRRWRKKGGDGDETSTNTSEVRTQSAFGGGESYSPFLEQRATSVRSSAAGSMISGRSGVHVPNALGIVQRPILSRCLECVVLFADFVNFTTHTSSMEGIDVVRMLNSVYSRFDDLCVRYHVEKIKTIGDAFVAYSERHSPRGTASVLNFAIEMQREAKHGSAMELRIGVCQNEGTLGIVGSAAISFDIYGPARLIAEACEVMCPQGSVLVDSKTMRHVKGVVRPSTTTTTTSTDDDDPEEENARRSEENEQEQEKQEQEELCSTDDEVNDPSSRPGSLRTLTPTPSLSDEGFVFASSIVLPPLIVGEISAHQLLTTSIVRRFGQQESSAESEPTGFDRIFSEDMDATETTSTSTPTGSSAFDFGGVDEESTDYFDGEGQENPEDEVGGEAGGDNMQWMNTSYRPTCFEILTGFVGAWRNGVVFKRFARELTKHGLLRRRMAGIVLVTFQVALVGYPFLFGDEHTTYVAMEYLYAWILLALAGVVEMAVCISRFAISEKYVVVHIVIDFVGAICCCLSYFVVLSLNPSDERYVGVLVPPCSILVVYSFYLISFLPPVVAFILNLGILLPHLFVVKVSVATHAVHFSAWFALFGIEHYLRIRMITLFQSNQKFSLRCERLAVEQRSNCLLLLSFIPPSLIPKIGDLTSRHRSASTETEYQKGAILFARLDGFHSIYFDSLIRTRKASMMDDSVDLVTKKEDIEQDALRAVAVLSEFVSRLDDVCTTFGGFRVKTFNEGYLCLVASFDLRDSAHRAADIACGFVQTTDEMIAALGYGWLCQQEDSEMDEILGVRIGAHCGGFQTAVVGKIRFLFDIFGKDVNYASRMCETSSPGHIHVSEAMHDEIAGKFEFDKREAILKGFGKATTYQLQT